MWEIVTIVVIYVFTILKYIVCVWTKTDTSFEGGRGESTAALLNCTQVQGGWEKAASLTQSQALGKLHTSFFMVACVGWK